MHVEISSNDGNYLVCTNNCLTKAKRRLHTKQILACLCSTSTQLATDVREACGSPRQHSTLPVSEVASLRVRSEVVRVVEESSMCEPKKGNEAYHGEYGAGLSSAEQW